MVIIAKNIEPFSKHHKSHEKNYDHELWQREEKTKSQKSPVTNVITTYLKRIKGGEKSL